MKKILSILFLLAITFPTFAEKLSDADRDLIHNRIQTTLEKINNGNFQDTLKELSPKLANYFANKEGLTVSEFGKRQKQFFKSGVPDVKMSYSYDLTKVSVHSSSKNRRYAFIPVELKISPVISGKDILVDVVLLAFEDDKKWYFVEWSKLLFLTDFFFQIYPDLKDVRFLHNN